MLDPHGKGKFKDGTKGLVSSDFEDSTLASGCTAKAGSSQACPCIFTLDPSSGYAVTADGTATASLIWIAAGTNDVACPTSPSFTLIDQWNFVLAQGGETMVMDGNNNGFEEGRVSVLAPGQLLSEVIPPSVGRINESLGSAGNCKMNKNPSRKG